MNYINFSFIFISFFFTFFVGKFLKKLGLYDVPTERSMHTFDIVRGGGLAVVVCLMLLISYHLVIDSLDNVFGISMIICIFVVGLLGLCDDFKSLSYKFRLLIHFLVASFAVLILQDNINNINLYPLPINGIFKDLFFILFIVWFINLYNFMDGINGIASAQAIYFFSSLTALSIFIPDISHEIYLGYSAIFFGFLLWNFPNPRIFLGDVGSGSIGVFIAVNIISISSIDPNLFWISLILMSIFIVDTTFTLLVRILLRQSFHQAHNSHVYQKSAAALNSHTMVTSIIIFFNTVIILPLIAVFLIFKWNLFYLLLAVYLFLASLALYLKAGRSE